MRTTNFDHQTIELSKGEHSLAVDVEAEAEASLDDDDEGGPKALSSSTGKFGCSKNQIIQQQAMSSSGETFTAGKCPNLLTWSC